jgi:hypothetical protein
MGRNTIDLAGQRFGRLTILTREPRQPGASGQAKWLCRCDCGTIKTVRGNALRTGATQSCGCLLHDMLVTRNTTHGLAPREGRPRAYSSWANMVRRCTHTDDPRYPEWGGRGITVCERWLSFDNFLADMGERPPGMSIDRKDNKGNYEPGNCRWATPHEQQVNNENFKLTPDIVTEIKRLRTTGMTLAAIGMQLNLHRHTVSRALSGKTRQRNSGS